MINILKTSTVSFILVLNLCFTQEKKTNTITFTIVDKVLINNTCTKLLITNNSSSNYYLPILNDPESKKWNFILPTDETGFFFIHQIMYNLNNEKLSWIENNCFDGSVSKSFSDFDEKWKQKKKDLRIEDLILLKAGQSKYINVPVNLHVEFSDNCFWEIKDYKNEKELKITYYYRKKQVQSAAIFLNSKIVDKLKKLNYKLYEKEIESNQVKLIF